MPDLSRYLHIRKGSGGCFTADGKRLVFVTDVTGVPQAWSMPAEGGWPEQLTFGEFTPNTGAGNYDESDPVSPGGAYDSLGYGILNLGPAPVAGGKIAFTSNRNGFLPPKGFTHPTLQLFVMDEDGGNVTAIAPMTISSALHPVPLRDGRLMFSSHESQALLQALYLEFHSQLCAIRLLRRRRYSLLALPCLPAL